MSEMSEIFSQEKINEYTTRFQELVNSCSKYSGSTGKNRHIKEVENTNEYIKKTKDLDAQKLEEFITKYDLVITKIRNDETIKGIIGKILFYEHYYIKLSIPELYKLEEDKKKAHEEFDSYIDLSKNANDIKVIEDIDTLNKEYLNYLNNNCNVLFDDKNKDVLDFIKNPQILFDVFYWSKPFKLSEYDRNSKCFQNKATKYQTSVWKIASTQDDALYFGPAGNNANKKSLKVYQGLSGLWCYSKQGSESRNTPYEHFVKVLDKAKDVINIIKNALTYLSTEVTNPIDYYSTFYDELKSGELANSTVYRFLAHFFPSRIAGWYNNLEAPIKILEEIGLDIEGLLSTYNFKDDKKDLIINGTLALVMAYPIITYPELIAVNEELKYMNIDRYKQVVFTGAPGTGKTFGVKKYVEKKCGNDKNRYKFVQFHSSYDYSDFVEGLRPVTLKREAEPQSQPQSEPEPQSQPQSEPEPQSQPQSEPEPQSQPQSEPAFVRLDGTFKAFCRRIVNDNLIYAGFELKNDSIESIHSVLIKFLQDEDKRKKYEDLLSTYKPGDKIDDKISSYNFDEDTKNAIKFSLGEKYYYFIVDEINRADLSRVFGELMYGLEESYRGIENRFDTQYKNLKTYKIEDGLAEEMPFDCFEDGFFIPHNLRFVGTMNDIDRSVESFDFALRRRFQWIDIKANDVMQSTIISMIDTEPEGIEKKYSIESLTKRIEEMNKMISENSQWGFSDSYHIGPAYFKKYKYDDESLTKIWDEKIGPILNEYSRGKKEDEINTFVNSCRDKLFKEISYQNTLPDKSKTAQEIAAEKLELYKQIVFTGAPGTGKTFGVQTAVKELCDGEEGRYKFVQFHSSYDYSDFVEGLRPVKIFGKTSFVRLDGTFKAFCRHIVNDNLSDAGYKQTNEDIEKIYSDLINYFKDDKNREEYEELLSTYKPGDDINDKISTTDEEIIKAIKFSLGKKYYYFIVDEINRADLSKVFGELMYGLEESYRGIENRFDTQYINLNTYEVNKDEVKAMPFDCFKNGFFIPHNLVFVGTMNDIDRSVESFDFALRRRFQWIDISAENVMTATLKEMGIIRSDNDDLIKRIVALNDVISGTKANQGGLLGLNKAYHVGPAYFKNCDVSNLNSSLKVIWKDRLESLLREYVRGRDNTKVKIFIEKCEKALITNKKS